MAKQDLLDDLRFLNEAVINGHPVNYRPDRPIDLHAVVDSAARITGDSVDPRSYSLWIEQAIHRICCVHTHIAKDPIAVKRSTYSFIPMSTSLFQGRMIIADHADPTRVGEPVLSINGVKAEDIIRRYRSYKASDGRTDAFSKSYFRYASSVLIAEHLGHPDTFIVSTTKGEFTLPGSAAFHPTKARPIPNTILTNDHVSLAHTSGVDLLTVGSFESGDRKLFRRIFAELRTRGSTHLVLDLRQNTGGDRHAAVALTSHLVDTTFSYAILRPKLKTRRYLNGKGKRNELLSRLKYDIGNFHRAKRTALGKAFSYRYRPTRENHYHGRIHVITDGFTASSSTMVTSWLKQFTNATFVGGQAGGGYNGNNGGSFCQITLPRSGIGITFPAYRLILDPASVNDAGIKPDIEIDPDLPIEKILEGILDQ
ncbi:MAG: S41 family peptidase [Flavobacteriales bacterium]